MWKLQPYCRKTSTDLKRLELFSMQILDAECKEIKGIETKISLRMYRPERPHFSNMVKLLKDLKAKPYIVSY